MKKITRSAMSKITMQDIADALDISRVTVWKVFNNQPGVSDNLRIQILDKAKELGYQKNLIPQTPITQTDHRTVSVIVSRPESAVFWINIIHRVAQELVDYNTDLIYTYVPSICPDSYTLPESLTNGTIKGCIILNVYDMKMIQLINQLDIPKVFLDTVTDFPASELNGDLFLLEGIQTVQTLTNHIIGKGRTQIGFIGDIKYARTNSDRYLGYKMAMEENHLEIKPSYCLTTKLGIYSYQEEIRRFLNGLEVLPEAFVCASDYIAHFLQSYLSEHNIRVPRDIAITGYDGTSEYSNVANILTTADVNTWALGKRLSHQLLFLIDNPSFPKEIVYILPTINYKKSTDF